MTIPANKKPRATLLSRMEAYRDNTIPLRIKHRKSIDDDWSAAHLYEMYIILDVIEQGKTIWLEVIHSWHWNRDSAEHQKEKYKTGDPFTAPTIETINAAHITYYSPYNSHQYQKMFLHSDVGERLMAHAAELQEELTRETK